MESAEKQKKWLFVPVFLILLFCSNIIFSNQEVDSALLSTWFVIDALEKQERLSTRDLALLLKAPLTALVRIETTKQEKELPAQPGQQEKELTPQQVQNITTVLEESCKKAAPLITYYRIIKSSVWPQASLDIILRFFTHARNVSLTCEEFESADYERLTQHSVKLPAEIKVLWVSRGNLTFWPACFAHLSSLVILHAEENHLDKQALRTIIQYHQQLEHLFLYHNWIQAIPNKITQLKKIKELSLSTNPLSPEAFSKICELSTLETLDVSHCYPDVYEFGFRKARWTTFPDNIGNLKNLQSLKLEGQKFPEDQINKLRGTLPNLKTVMLTDWTSGYTRTIRS